MDALSALNAYLDRVTGRIDVKRFILIFLFASIILAGTIYILWSATSLNWAEKSSLLNTLLLSDVLLFIGCMLITAIYQVYVSVKGNVTQRNVYTSILFISFVGFSLLSILYIMLDLAFKPLDISGFDALIGLVLSIAATLSSGPYILILADSVSPGRTLSRLMGSAMQEYLRSGADGAIEHTGIMNGSSDGKAVSDYKAFIIGLSNNGDTAAVRKAVRDMESAAIIKYKEDDRKGIAYGRRMASMIAEIGIDENIAGAVVHDIMDSLANIVCRAESKDVVNAAFNGLGRFMAASESRPDSYIALHRAYIRIYDTTGRKDALNACAEVTGRIMAALGPGSVNEERAMAVYRSGMVKRRIAEETENEDDVDRAISGLSDALGTIPEGTMTIERAGMEAELGRAYMLQSKLRTPVKSLRNAIGCFTSAIKTLTPSTFPYDAARIQLDMGHAYSKLSEEYGRLKRHDEALSSGRSAISVCTEAIKAYRPEEFPEEYTGAISDLGLAHTIVGETYARTRMFDQALRHAGMALGAYSKALDSMDLGSMPEGYASIKTSMGITNVTIAELHFREKRFDEAISCCDSAIAAYNEAIRIYDDAGREKLARSTRKYLKDATDLFNTLMRLGDVDDKLDMSG